MGCAGSIGSNSGLDISSESGVNDDSTEEVAPDVASLAELTSPPDCCTHGVNEKNLP